tara:strand:+ start:193 stop:477 length:285 start_codon:yes stop_codon:yes gene_type:complete
VQIESNILSDIFTFLAGGAGVKILDHFLNKKNIDAQSDALVSNNWREYAQNIELKFAELRNEHDELMKKYYSLYAEFQQFKISANEKINNNGGA